MSAKFVTQILVVLVFLGLQGCVWVDLKPQAQKVRILNSAEVAQCKAIAQVTANTTDKIGFIARDRDSVQEEVNLLARNHAADLGGDSLLPAGPMLEGQQKFKVYRCINP